MPINSLQGISLTSVAEVVDVKVDGVSVVNNKIANIDLTGKQDNLIEGDNITIENNIISARGYDDSHILEELDSESNRISAIEEDYLTSGDKQDLQEEIDNKVDKDTSTTGTKVYARVNGVEQVLEPKVATTGNTLVIRDNAGRFSAGAPVDSGNVANKQYVDSLVNNKQDKLVLGEKLFWDSEGRLDADVPEIPVATNTSLGITKGNQSKGTNMEADGTVAISPSSNSQIKNKNSNFNPIVPSQVDLVVKTGITTNTIELTDLEKEKAHEWLGIEEAEPYDDSWIRPAINSEGEAVKAWADGKFLTEHQDISGKADKTYVDYEVAKKQDKLSVGENITIHDNVISAIDTIYDDTEVKSLINSEGQRISAIEAKEAGWDAKSDFSGDYNDLTNKPEIPSIEGLATEEYVDNSIEEVKELIPTVPTNVSAFVNDAGYITEHQSLDGYATEEYVENHHDDTKQNVITTLEDIKAGAAKGMTAVQPADIADMATKSYVDSEGQSIKDWADDKFLTEHQDISGKQDKLTAGANITITSEGVISATGGSGQTLEAGNGLKIEDDVISARLGDGLKFDSEGNITPDTVEIVAGKGLQIHNHTMDVRLRNSNPGLAFTSEGDLYAVGGSGGEPDAYIKNASVDSTGNTLTLTKKDDSTITFSPSGGSGGSSVYMVDYNSYAAEDFDSIVSAINSGKIIVLKYLATSVWGDYYIYLDLVQTDLTSYLMFGSTGGNQYYKELHYATLNSDGTKSYILTEPGGGGGVTDVTLDGVSVVGGGVAALKTQAAGFNMQIDEKEGFEYGGAMDGPWSSDKYNKIVGPLENGEAIAMALLFGDGARVYVDGTLWRIPAGSGSIRYCGHKWDSAKSLNYLSFKETLVGNATSGGAKKDIELELKFYQDGTVGHSAKAGFIIPELPSDASSKIYVLKSVNGISTWVEE